jgi:hypothetical protein
MALNRRSFLRAGMAGALLLSTVGGVYRLTRSPAALQAFVLDDQGRAVLRALIPVLLDGVVGQDGAAAQAALERTIATIRQLPLRTQKEVQDVFALLALGPARRLLAGVPDGWAQAKPEDIAAFLQSWRVHRVGMLQTAYHALHDLVLGAWYSDPAAWPVVGYPGPPFELN